MIAETSAARAGRAAQPPPRASSGEGGGGESDRIGDLVAAAAAAFDDFRAGIPGGMERLVRLVSPLLWHTARQCGLSTDQAEDSVQQTFLMLVRRADSIADPLAVIRWLTVTLRRQAWRDRAADLRQTGREPTEALFPAQPSAEAQALLNEEQRRLWVEVEQLSQRCRRLLAVVAFSPRPDYLAVARELQMPVGSIGPTRGRCLDKLRSRLQGDGWE